MKNQQEFLVSLIFLIFLVLAVLLISAYWLIIIGISLIILLICFVTKKIIKYKRRK